MCHISERYFFHVANWMHTKSYTYVYFLITCMLRFNMSHANKHIYLSKKHNPCAYIRTNERWTSKGPCGGQGGGPFGVHFEHKQLTNCTLSLHSLSIRILSSLKLTNTLSLSASHHGSKEGGGKRWEEVFQVKERP